MIARSFVSLLALTLIAVAMPALLTGCPAPALPGLAGAFAGDFGATQGGVQDMGLARELVAAGRVPPAEAFVVEGMFSEHELGLTGEPCERLLCLRTAVGMTPGVNEESSAWLQVGLSSTIDLDTFERPSVTIIATVDVSGSMGWDYATERTEFQTPGEVSRNLLAAIAGELGSSDQMAIVTYGTTVNALLPVTNGADQVTLQNAVDALGTGGSTNMEAGLQLAYETARSVQGQADETRIVLFTDVQPNVGATTPTEFEMLVAEGAADGIGLTVMGVGVGLRQELFTAISHLRGGNAFTLFDNDDVTKLMADDWPWFVSPIAYDLSLEMTPGGAYAVAETYGFPASASDDEVGFNASTVFLSRRKGALLVRFAPVAGADSAESTIAGLLSYQTPDGELVEQPFVADLSDATVDQTGRYFEQPSVAKSVALALLVSSMADAAETYGEDADSAVGMMRAVVAWFAMEAEGDETLAPELEFANEVLQLMVQGADQGDLYNSGRSFF